MTYVPVLLANWLVCILVEIVTTAPFTDIVNGVCVFLPYARSSAVEQTVAYCILIIFYFLPLALMIFCYSRIVYRLRTKVTSHVTSSL